MPVVVSWMINDGREKVEKLDWIKQMQFSHFLIVFMIKEQEIKSDKTGTYFCHFVEGNGFLICTVIVSPQLHTPMYYFLCNLSFLDLCYSSCSVPKLLIDVLSEKRRISVTMCITQMNIGLILGGIECMLLAVMAYDRYIAICSPLRYTVIMSWRGGAKAFSTCASHLTVVFLFFGTTMTTYIGQTRSFSPYLKYISLIYIVVTPVLNPFIYSLRNNDVKKAFRKLLSRYSA
ncbi:olfactory receptor 5V1-like [Engystomops pustulosus]|uniref:olfactory receptor 5V1-like n=1 Tax=Engystomops pustulosus TaxID=76066 RepID=UPI003AFA4869